MLSSTERFMSIIQTSRLRYTRFRSTYCDNHYQPITKSPARREARSPVVAPRMACRGRRNIGRRADSAAPNQCRRRNAARVHPRPRNTAPRGSGTARAGDVPIHPCPPRHPRLSRGSTRSSRARRRAAIGTRR
ncbi:hypothetical protein BC628DRAFT_1101385 [Trametes gibbosa]|nr:hypothetical protein BC628DRAFT_1101385 [Trametes gibbosa]